MQLKTSAAKWWQFCLGLNVLKASSVLIHTTENVFENVVCTTAAILLWAQYVKFMLACQFNNLIIVNCNVEHKII